jgi:hypothetical protein
MNWEVSSLDCKVSEDGLSDVVYCAHWRCSATEVDGDKTYSASVYSTCSVPGPNPASFVPFDQLTQDEVLGWIWANGVDKAATEAAVEAQLELQKHPVTVSLAPPWVSA